VGENAVGRVIARPFVGEPGAFHRTEGRKDFPLNPPHTVLDVLVQSERKVHAIGKIYEFFNGRVSRPGNIPPIMRTTQPLFCGRFDPAKARSSSLTSRTSTCFTDTATTPAGSPELLRS